MCTSIYIEIFSLNFPQNFMASVCHKAIHHNQLGVNSKMQIGSASSQFVIGFIALNLNRGIKVNVS